jgi:outer membrane protein
MVVKNPLFSVTGPGEKLARRSLFLAAPGAGVLLAQTVLAQAPAAQTAAPAAPSSAAPAAGSFSAPKPFKVGIINAELALARTKEGQKAAEELEQKLGPRNAELQKLNTDIQDLQKRLDQGGNLLAATTKTELQNSIQTKTRALQRGQQDFQDEVQKQRSLVLADLYAKMEGVLDKFAADNGFSLILNDAMDNTPVLWASTEIEITQAVIDAYDKAAPAAPKAAAPAKQPGAPSPAKPNSLGTPAQPKSPAAAPKQP